MPQSVRDILELPFLLPLARVLAYILIGYLVLKFIDAALSRLPSLLPADDALGHARVKQRAETMRHIIRGVSRVIGMAVVLPLIASELPQATRDYLKNYLAGAGIVGLAIGFGAQSLVKDVISGFFILLEDQYGVGDVVKIGDFSGVVERMTLRATVLRNVEGQVHVVPNGNIQHVTVMTKEWARAVLDITVRHEEDLAKIFTALERVGKRLAVDFHDRISETPSILGVEKLDPSGITVRCVVKTPPFKQADVMREWRRRVKDEFDRCGIQLAQKQPV